MNIYQNIKIIYMINTKLLRAFLVAPPNFSHQNN
jgi:hypothetical protein